MALLAAAAVATKISPYQQQMWSGGSGSTTTTTSEYGGTGGDTQLSNPAGNAKYFSYSINRSSSASSSNLFPRSHLSGQLKTEGQLIRIS